MNARFALVEIEKLRDHEEVSPAHVEEVVARLAADGVVETPIVADERTLVVLDGHHRLNALRRLNARAAPVHLVDYMDPGIVVEAWRAGDPPPSKQDVVLRGTTGRLFPPKSTRHPTLYRLPRVRTPLADLGVVLPRA